MEALLELEKVQRVLSFMGSRGLSDSAGGGDGDRFLAHFLLFLVQPFDSLSMEKKVAMVSELLKEVNSDTLKEVQHLTSLEGIDSEDEVRIITPLPSDQDISSGDLLRQTKNFKTHTEKLTIQDVPMIGFDAMMRANSTLEDFCRSYFIFHGLDVNKPQAVFKFLPFLSFTESYIYQLDASNEDSLHFVPGENSSTVLEMKKEVSSEISLSDKLDSLDNLLQCQGLMTDQLRNELKSGIQYWSLERKLCQALLRNDKISIEDVMKAIHLKSFDYRVLNLMMYRLTGQQVNELHMEFLSVSEFLVEISDDLYDYEDDVINNTFNILRMFAAIYGSLDAPKMLAKCIGEAEEKYESFSKKLDPSISRSYWRRCEEATKEGGKISGHAYGTWNIPPLIRDEESFRLDRLNKDDSIAMTVS
ncbi:uncharacterized protein LOC100837836 isoform X1 [Brachypodium distachyon]|uniref:uncharacterized protein LOC100837836 isoform X1 n=1 Tax=Brachypodium distachyon TaxID=15368 RepID=UPI0001C6FA6B|nr:uncharacterized protein LOC100837836 isoform X1 [Brachypodium distachyon]XP_010239975.1 uncharacterized protein LOC100837836 isoform X1 [Brachypodium distachyon]XP_010239976.1 uncharacterized protein LOC100837836 isoform X1 [Brachypodium distachyon]|eukprot:XP_010239972.1 uncharacterized protein LOC100837836 isoform X1 [Brachypodium distachyon]